MQYIVWVRQGKRRFATIKQFSEDFLKCLIDTGKSFCKDSLHFCGQLYDQRFQFLFCLRGILQLYG